MNKYPANFPVVCASVFLSFAPSFTTRRYF
jgi:hypothetical protein